MTDASDADDGTAPLGERAVRRLVEVDRGWLATAIGLAIVALARATG